MVATAQFSTWQNNTNAKWWLDKGLRKNMASIALLYMAVFTFGYDGSLLNGLQALPEWKLFFNNPAGSDLGLISAAYYLPSIPIALVAAYSNERWGRRFTLFVGAALTVLGVFVTTFANGRGMLIGGRAILGLGTPWMGVAGPSLLLELAHPRLRAIAGGLFLGGYYVGSLVSAWLCFAMTQRTSISGNWVWRLPSIFQLTGPAAILAGLYWLPESPRWLLSQGRDDEAIEIYSRHHANGARVEDDELLRMEISEIREAMDMAKRVPQKGYMDFLKTPANRHRLLCIFTVGAGAQLNGVSIISYYLSPILALIGVTSPTQIALINGGLSLWNLILSVIAALQVERLGRRFLWLSGSSGMFLTFAVVTGLSGAYASSPTNGLGVGVIVMLFVFFGFYDISFTVLPNLYLPEILPFELRSKGLALASLIGSVALAFNQYVNPVALEALAWKYYFVYLGIQATLFTLIYFKFPETKGRTPEEILFLFDRNAEIIPARHLEEDKEDKEYKADIEHMERS